MSNADAQAYPVAAACNETLFKADGLTKRELFAAMAMQGLMGDEGNEISAKVTAATSVILADALLAELEKGKEAK